MSYFSWISSEYLNIRVNWEYAFLCVLEGIGKGFAIDFGPTDRSSSSRFKNCPTAFGSQSARCREEEGHTYSKLLFKRRESIVILCTLWTGALSSPWWVCRTYVSICLVPTSLFSRGWREMHSIVSLEIVKHEKLA